MLNRLPLRMIVAMVMLGAATAIGGQLPASAPDMDPACLLRTDSFWRCYVIRGTETIRTADGELVPVLHEEPIETVRGATRKERIIRIRKAASDRLWTPAPHHDWLAPDFDDSAWAMLRGPFFAVPHAPDGNIYRSVPAMYLRGKFQVEDPARLGDLTVKLSFHGGAAVYLNGRQIARRYLPDGKLTPLTLAEDYPSQAFFDDEGMLRPRHDPTAEIRSRRIDRLTIPSAQLVKGTNVLAIEIHRAPLPEAFLFAKTRQPRNSYFIRTYGWPRCGLASLELRGSSADGATANAGHTGPPAGVHVWVWPIEHDLSPDDYCNPLENGQSIRLFGARNGAFSGQVVVRSDQPMDSVTATCSDLSGPAGTIPAGAVKIRYRIDAPPRSIYRRNLPDRYEALSPRPVAGPQAGLMPIAFTVHVPPDAAAGEYRGTVTVNVGKTESKTPLLITVADWRLPSPRDFFTAIGLFQSPESLAMHYNVAMWSPQHWRLIEATFERMAELGCKEVYLTAIARTHLGNEHGMIRFRRNGDKLTPDLSIARRYLELAAKHLGRPTVACVYCWEHTGGGSYPSHLTIEQRNEFERKVLITVVDGDGKLSVVEGPAWGGPNSRPFWKSVFDGVRTILDEHGLTDSLMIGIAGDYVPSERALADLKEASSSAPWVRQTHSSSFSISRGDEHKVAYLASAWGAAASRDPEIGRYFGWAAPAWKVVTREFPGTSAFQRVYLEAKVCGAARIGNADFGLRGIGRMGADFWPVIGEAPRKFTLFGRYPDTAWGQLNVRLWMPAFFAPGPDGAMHCLRSELMRHSMQEIEARIFLEKALADPAARQRLGELVDAIQPLLDNRLRIANATIWQYSNDWTCTLASNLPELSRRLYGLAGEAAKRLQPQGAAPAPGR